MSEYLDGTPEVSFTMEVAETVQSPVDPTLTIEGMAADAKATGDAIADAVSELQEDIGETNTALQAAKTELQGAIGGNTTLIGTTKTELQGDIATAKTDVEGQIQAAQTDLEGQIDGAKNELQEDIDAVSASVDAVAGLLFPVGSVYISTSSEPPTFGEGWNWQEIMIPVTQGDLMDGSRSYTAATDTDEPGTLHFWMRMEAE